MRFDKCNKARPCPICGREKHCQTTAEGPVQCMWAATKGGGVPVPPPAGFARGKPTRDGGWMYLPVDADGRPAFTELNPEMVKARTENDEKRRLKAIDQARRCWREAGETGKADRGNDHPRVRGYLEARGIPLDKLPGGATPKALRYHPYAKDWTAWKDYPAMVASVVDASGHVQGVHCTYLDSQRNAKRDPAIGTQKMMRGSCKGRAIRMARDFPDGVLVLAEGIETALSVMAATGWTAWACMSAAGMANIEISPEMIGGDGPVKRVLIAADLNPPGKQRGSGRTGEKAAAVLRNRLLVLAPGLEVFVVAPSLATAGALVGLDTREKQDEVSPACNGCVPLSGEGVDWNDVLVACGAKAVRDAFVSPAPHAPSSRQAGTGNDAGPVNDAGGPGEAGVVVRREAAWVDEDEPAPWNVNKGLDLPIIENGSVERARRWLWKRMRVEGQNRFALAYWGGTFWVYGRGRYVKADEVELAANVLHWMNGHRHWKGKSLKPLEPTTRMADEVLKAAITDVRVHTDRMPVWLPDHLDIEGNPRWGEATSVEALTARMAKADVGLSQLIVLEDSILDVSRTGITRSVTRRDHTASLFASAQLPFPLLGDQLQDLLDGKPEAEVLGKMCPKFCQWRADAFDDPADAEQLQLMVGDVISLNRQIEKLFLTVGLGRSGKGYIGDIVAAVVGGENMASTSFDELNDDKFSLAPLVGKIYVTLPDAHLESMRKTGAMEKLKSISGQDTISVRDLQRRAVSVKLPARVWIYANEEPDFRDDSGAFAGRLCILPLKKSRMGREDPTIKASVPDEAPGLLLWAIMGAMKLARMNPRKIEMGPGGAEISDAFKRESAKIQAFVEECVLHGEAAGDGHTTAVELYEAYLWYCSQMGWKNPVGEPMFFRRLAWHVPRWDRSQPRAGQARVESRKGVCLRDHVGRERKDGKVVEIPNGTLPNW